MDELQVRRHVVAILCLMTLISNVASNVFEDMQEKRAWPEVRGTLATKRSTPDSINILDDNANRKKAAIENMESKVLQKLQREIREAHANYKSQPGRRTEFTIGGDEEEDVNRPVHASNPGQVPAESPGQIETNRLANWPTNLLYQIQHPSFQRRVGDQRDKDSQRIDYHVDQDFPVDKRKPFDVDWHVVRGKRAKRSKNSGKQVLDTLNELKY